jgi:pterin-4a-carbinolamine dehydratase
MNTVNALNVNKKKRLPPPDDGGAQAGAAEVRPQGRQKLKSERVQQKLKSERVQELLRSMPDWELSATGRGIGRQWRFPKPRVAAAYANFVSELAVSEGQTVHLILSGADVTLSLTSRLRGGSREGLTEKVFRFAARLG